MATPEISGIIGNSDILSDSYVPDNIPGRESQIRELGECLDPVSRKKKPLNAWVYGPPGTGKTATAMFILRQVFQKSRIYGVYVNCWERGSLYSVLEKVVTELRILGADKPDSSFKMQRLQRHLKDIPLVLVLDEIDHPCPKEMNSILYNLCNLENTGLICISNSRDILFGLDERVRSRLAAKEIEFHPYSIPDLVYILTLMAEAALIPRTWDKELLEQIAQLADGDARVAVQTLKNAAYNAEKSGSRKVMPEHIDTGSKDAKVMKKAYLLNNLTPDHRLIYEIIKGKEGILSGELWEAYLSDAGRRGIGPIASRTFSEYLNRLLDLGLIRAERARKRGKVRVFGVAE